MPDKDASMGPASENAGYVIGIDRIDLTLFCFNGSGVRERRLCYRWQWPRGRVNAASMGPASENAGYARIGRAHGRYRLAASMGPASKNAGYDYIPIPLKEDSLLQWVRRPRTPVMGERERRIDNPAPCFNGSGVRERRLWRT